MPIISTAITINDLPPPPADKTGWPWTESTPPLGDRRPDGSEWPRISIVTPSYNQGQFLEETIRSVLLQGYPNLEYIIIDGGSTDQSVEIIKKYKPWLAYWVSEPDKGQADALNKGFAQASGYICAYLNSDDVLLNKILETIANTFCHWNCHWLASSVLVGASISQSQIWEAAGGDFASFIVQQSFAQQGVFWRFNITEKPYFNPQFNFIMDYDFFMRLYEKNGSPFLLQKTTAFFRVHADSKTSTLIDLYHKEHNNLVNELCDRLPQFIVNKVLLEQKRKRYRDEALQLLKADSITFSDKLATALRALQLLVKTPHPLRDRIFFSVAIRLLAKVLLPIHIYRK
ncbi:MAG TPA: glycosyltransferase family 2 protein [Cyanophyceae cyanobacterium]